MPQPPRTYREEIKLLNSAANIASGLGEHGLATRLWALVARLKAAGTGPRLEDK